MGKVLLWMLVGVFLSFAGIAVGHMLIDLYDYFRDSTLYEDLKTPKEKKVE